MSLKNQKILIGMTGGIACYKIPYLVRFLHKEQAEVQVVMTEAATKFITPLTLETVSERPVLTKLFDDNSFVATRHIDLAVWPDLIVITPATANFLGKVASGISDDLLTTVVCASDKPIMIVPAMNPTMWNNPVTQRNFNALKDLGYLSVDPGEGDTACGHLGVGRMAEPETIFDAIRTYFSQGKKKSSGVRKSS